MDRYCYVFYVTHRYFVAADTDGSDINEVKEIGVYSSRKLAQCAIQRFAHLPGFSSYPDGFSIARVQCYFSTSDSKADLSHLFSPYYEEYLPAADCDDVMRGVFFEAESDAEAVVQQWKQAPDARTSGEYATIEYVLNEDVPMWSEGFSS